MCKTKTYSCIRKNNQNKNKPILYLIGVKLRCFKEAKILHLFINKKLSK